MRKVREGGLMDAVRGALGIASRHENGKEIPDNTPVEVPVRLRVGESQEARMRRMIESAVSRQAERDGHETFEESQDFDVEDGVDEFDVTTSAEMDDEALEERVSLRAELREREEERKMLRAAEKRGFFRRRENANRENRQSDVGRDGYGAAHSRAEPAGVADSTAHREGEHRRNEGAVASRGRDD